MSAPHDFLLGCDCDHHPQPPKETTMGTYTRLMTRKIRHDAGLKPATGERLRILERLQKDASMLIQMLALEEAGARDGDGFWHGCDPIHSALRAMVLWYDRYETASYDDVSVSEPAGMPF